MILPLEDFTPASPISPLVLVGVCAAGKSTLAHGLQVRGIQSRAVAQEHSQVPTLYRRSGNLVVLLVADWGTVHRRRHLAWDPGFYRAEWERIRLARDEAALVIHTDWLNPQQVANRVTEWYDARLGFDNVWRSRPELADAEQARIRAQWQTAR